MDQWELWGRVSTVRVERAQRAHHREKLGQWAIFLPVHTILHPRNVGQPHNATRILLVPTAPKARRRGHRQNRNVRQRGQSISQPERDQSKSKFLIDITNKEERMQNNTH